MAMKNKLAWLYLFWVIFYFLNKIIGRIQDLFWVSSVNSTKFPIYFAKFHKFFLTLSNVYDLLSKYFVSLIEIFGFATIV
jgi:hypothetical protein